MHFPNANKLEPSVQLHRIDTTGTVYVAAARYAQVGKGNCSPAKKKKKQPGGFPCNEVGTICVFLCTRQFEDLHLLFQMPVERFWVFSFSNKTKIFKNDLKRMC